MIHARSMLLAIGTALIFSGSLPARTWKTSLGRTFEAEFEKIDGNTAIFVLPDGRRFSMSVADLSPEERNFLKLTGPSVMSELVAASFGSPWPSQVRIAGPVTCKVVKEDPKTGVYIYQSPSYRFICDARITEDALRNFSVMFETTRKYARALPLSLGGAAGPEERRRDIILFSTMQGYAAAGGMPGTVGLYVHHKGLVLVPMESLGLKLVGTGFSIDQGITHETLIHELTHQLTPRVYFAPGAKGWFSEGTAEYVATTPYTWGYFQPDVHGNIVKARVTGHGIDNKGGYALGSKIKVPPLKSFFLMPYDVFAGKNASLNYGFSLLLVNFFFHMDDGGKARRISDFLLGLHAGKQGEEALKPLLAGGSYQKLEQEISAAWAKKGIEIQFER
jgi:hypothetical protein